MLCGWNRCAVVITVQSVTQWSFMETRSQQPQSASETRAAAEFHSKHEERGEFSAPGFTGNVLRETLTVWKWHRECRGLLTWCPSVGVACECFWSHTSPSTLCPRLLHPCVKVNNKSFRSKTHFWPNSWKMNSRVLSEFFLTLRSFTLVCTFRAMELPSIGP